MGPGVLEGPQDQQVRVPAAEREVRVGAALALREVLQQAVDCLEPGGKNKSEAGEKLEKVTFIKCV